MYPCDHGYQLVYHFTRNNTEVMRPQTMCPKLRNSSRLSHYLKGVVDVLL